MVGRRFKASTQERNDLLERFVQATRNGDMEGLVALLSRDVALHSDGGGKAIALPDRIHGAETVARGLLTSFKKNVPKSIVGRISQINGQRGLIGYLDGKPFSVLSFHIRDGRIQAIYVVTNPEKLSHLPGLRATLT